MYGNCIKLVNVPNRNCHPLNIISWMLPSLDKKQTEIELKTIATPLTPELAGYDSIDAIESLWPTVITKIGLDSAELLSSSYADLARRVYVIDECVYKITLLEHETTSRLRIQDLQGEYNILRDCEGIPGVPSAIKWQHNSDFEMLIIERMDGETVGSLGIIKLLLVLCKLSVIIVRLASRGVSHNDLTCGNILLTNKGRVSLVDFDQASRTGFVAGIIRSFLGIEIGGEKMCGSILTIIKDNLKEKLSPKVKAVIKRLIGRRLNNKLPVLPTDASSNLKMFLEAWKIAQTSDASAPQMVLAYYSFNFEGCYFPGERPWENRWKVLRSITTYSDKRILELGCNMSFLSCFLLKEEKVTAALGVDIDANILKAAKLVSTALGVAPEYKQQNFDSLNDWEEELTAFKPDIVFALNVLNWVQDKERLMNFLGSFNEVIFEGHDDFETEKGRFASRGFMNIDLVCMTERNRPVLHCRK